MPAPENCPRCQKPLLWQGSAYQWRCSRCELTFSPMRLIELQTAEAAAAKKGKKK